MKPVALITGGSRGIGLGVAQALLEKGYRVAINGVRPANLVASTLEELKSNGGEVIYCQGDIGNGDDRQKMIDDIKSKWNQLNLLVNNAGVAPKERKDILEAEEDSFDWLIGINLKGPYFLTQLAANWMIDQKKIKPEDDYVGQRIWVSSSGKLSSKWHIQSGQCKENSYWSNREYKGEIPNSFARGGQAYILSRNAMQQINKVYSMNDLEELSKIHIYEDVMVGLLLEKAGINVKHLRFGVKI